jgi:hypothetical protein
MGYKCCASYSADSCSGCGGDYNIHSHGDIGAFYNSITNADLPQYTSRFYHPSQHELFSDVRYSKFEIGYDDALRHMHNASRGPPVEAYLPVPALIDDTASASPSKLPAVLIRSPGIMPRKSDIDEITRAHAELLKKEQKGRIVIRATEISQDIRIRRRVRKLEIFKN